MATRLKAESMPAKRLECMSLTSRSFGAVCRRQWGTRVNDATEQTLETAPRVGSSILCAAAPLRPSNSRSSELTLVPRAGLRGRARESGGSGPDWKDTQTPDAATGRLSTVTKDTTDRACLYPYLRRAEASIYYK